MEEPKKNRKSYISFWVIALCIFMLLQAFVFPNLFNHRVKEVSYDTFISMTENKEIGSVQIESSQITFTDKSEKKLYRTGVMEDKDLITRLYDSGAKFESKIDSGTSPILYILISYILPIALMVLVFHFFSKKMAQRMGGGEGSMMFGMGKSNAKVYVKSTTGIKFSDVAGEEEAKELLAEIVDFLHRPDRYKEIGASMPKGALLVGPPGTGKTLLAKAVAGEANVPFFSISGSEFVEMFVGMGAAKVRDLFKQANEKAPCIVFIDEIDTIGKKRDGGQMGGNDEREQTLNQLLTEMDGFDGSKGVVILAATNRPESLDPALLRPGRFDRRIPVELPDLQGRIDILKVHAKKIKLAGNVDFGAIARTAAGASGAELANIINEAALRAVRLGRSCATRSDGKRGSRNCRISEEKPGAFQQGKTHCLLPRSGTCTGGCASVTVGTGTENHHYSPYLRRAGLYHAGRGRRALPDDKNRTGKQDCYPHRRTRRRSVDFPRNHNGGFQRY